MGARHSTKRDCSLDNNDGAGDGISAIGKSTHRSSDKHRNRWSKVARSHSDRTPARLSVNQFNDAEAAGTKESLDCSTAVSCSSVSAACQTQVLSVSVTTQTEENELIGWKMIDDDPCSFASDLPSTEHDMGNVSNLDSSQKSISRIPADSKLHSHGVWQENLNSVSLIETKTCSAAKEGDSSVVCSDSYTEKHNGCNDAKIKPHSCVQVLSPENWTAIENFKPENKTQLESNSISNMQRQMMKDTSTNADISHKIEQSNVSESRSVAKHLKDVDQDQYDNVQMSQNSIHCRNASDMCSSFGGSSFGSLNSEDMMLDTEVDDMISPRNVKSRHSSVDAGFSAYRRRMSGRSMSTTCAAVPEYSEYFAQSVKYRNTVVMPQRVHSIDGRYSEYLHNDSNHSRIHSESAVIGDAVNGCIGLNAMSETCGRFVLLNLILLLQ